MVDATQFHRPAAFFVNGIGDHLMSLPALRALAALMRRCGSASAILLQKGGASGIDGLTFCCAAKVSS